MATKGLNQPVERLSDLLVIRISDSSNVEELEAKTVECGHRFSGLPGAETLVGLGATPLLEPERVEGRVHRGEQFRAVYFRVPGTQTRVLQVLGSATKANVGSADNAFVELLGDVVDATFFTSVWVADFSRLLRSLDYLSATWTALNHRCSQIRHGGGVIDMGSPRADFQFVIEAISATQDCEQIVRRTTEGKMRKYLDGRCPFSAHVLPDGYELDEERRIVLPGPAPIGLVSTIVECLADPRLSNAERVRRVAAVGGAGNRAAKLTMTATNGSDMVGRWYRQLEAWCTGVYEVDYELPGVLKDVGLPVEIFDTAEGRVWRLTYQLELPPGGWASDDAFAAALAARDRRREHRTAQGGAASGRGRKPFCGFPGWLQDGFQYQLFSGGQNYYELRRRPAVQASTQRTIAGQPRQVARGWGVRKEGEQVAVLSAVELHRTVAEGLVAAAGEGMTLSAATGALVASDDDILDDLREQLRQVGRRASNARCNANDAETDIQRRQFLDDANTAAAEQERLEGDILRLARTNAAGSVAVDADIVATALAAIADQPDQVPAEIADAFREVVHGLTLVPNSDRTVTWTAGLYVPLAGGTLKLGPASGRVMCGRQRELAARRTASLTDRAYEAADHLLGQGLDLKTTAEAMRIRTQRRVGQVIRDYLKRRGMSSGAVSTLVVDTPAPARAIVWHRLHDRPYPDKADRHFAAHIASTYLDGAVTWNPDRRGNRTRMGAGIRYLEGNGGWMADDELDRFTEAVGISMTTLGYWTNGRTRESGYTPPIFRRVQDGTSLISCPHNDCDGWATRICLLPEVPTLLLCPDCRRMPDTRYSAITFPDEYLELPGAV